MFENIDEWVKNFPELDRVVRTKPVVWINPRVTKMEEIVSLPVGKADMEEAARFMDRFAPFIAGVFPETISEGGHIHSPLKEVKSFALHRNQEKRVKIEGRLFLKCDNELAVAGSIKARGGFYEVLQFAVQTAMREGLLKEDEAADLSRPAFKNLFSNYTIGVGSTGNLGLSIGIISAQLGFKVNVFMSDDAKEWKKNLLRQKGANVIEIAGDFGVAIAEGRQETIADPNGYFVDDENSKQLFLGYSLAAFELQKQLNAAGVVVDNTHPLFIYSPCGVGGSPGGVAFGLKQVYGDAVYPFFVEPTHSPAVLTGLITGKKEKISVQDFGIDNITEADGLAVGRPSAFASGITEKLISGIYTIEDETLFELLQALYQTENIFLEPSAAAGLIGPEKILSTDFVHQHNIDQKNITHVAWATGGSLVPPNEREKMLQH